MNNYDEIDEKIEKILRADIYEPSSYTNTIIHALDKKARRKLINIPRLIATIIAGIMLISGVVYAKQIGEFIKRFFNNSQGVDTAVENGYFEKVDVEFKTESEIKANISYFLMDEYNVNFILNFNFDREKYRDISTIIPDLIIYNEKNDILYCSDKEMFKNFCTKTGVKLVFRDYNENYMNSVLYKNQTQKENEYSYNIKSETPYPESEKIFIEFNHLMIKSVDENNANIENEWKAVINLSEEFSNRQLISYQMVETNNNFVKNVRFDVYNTGTLLEVNAKFEPYIIDDMSESEKMEREKKFIEWGQNIESGEINNIFVKNDKNEIFTCSDSNIGDRNSNYFPDGTYYYKGTLNLTQYNLTDTLTLYFTIHAIDGDKNIEIKLQKND